MNAPHVRVAVIGAGFAGIGAAVRLARGGERSFVVLERADTVGGTWRDNVYPGVACDIPSHLYSYSFAPKADWERRFAVGADIQQYLEDCADEVRDRVHTGVALQSATWDAARQHWQLLTSEGPLTASMLVLATGRFTEPHIPDIAGLDRFAGPVCHTASWDAAAAQPGTRVGVVGTGASALQLVPQLLEQGVEVTVFQRTAPWVIPKDDARYCDTEIAQFLADDAKRSAHRQQIFDQMDAGFVARRIGSPEHDELRRRATDHLRAQVPNSAIRARVTPDYTVGCKRIVLSDEWYPALAAPGLTLETSALAEVSVSGVAIAASGAQHQLDALVFATGFNASHPPIGHLVHGRDGELLSAHWSDGMTSYASTAVSGFPNCFMLGGPNSALGHNSAVAILETQIAHLLDALASVPEGSACEVLPSAEAAYTQLLADKAANTVWEAGGCTSWYRDAATGRITLLWPGTATEYAERFSTFDPHSYALSPPHNTGADTGADIVTSAHAGQQLPHFSRLPQEAHR